MSDNTMSRMSENQGDSAPYIAHRRERDGVEQQLYSHLFAVGSLSAQNASKLKQSSPGAQEPSTLEGVGELLGLLHDLGKYSSEFQNYIKSATGLIDQDADEYVDAEKLRGRIDHSTAGAQFIWKAFPHDGVAGLIAQMLSLCIASHHSGMIDCISPAAEDVFTRRMSKSEDRSHSTEALSNIDQAVLERITELVESGVVVDSLSKFLQQVVRHEATCGSHEVPCQFKLGLLTRLLFSCLIDADRVDTADFEKPRGGRLRQQAQFTDWDQLIDRLENHLSDKPIANPIDELRRDVSRHCRVAADREQGIFTLTVPTGGGKTLASLRFALHHARRYGLDRVVYVIPFTSIIDQNADVVRSILEPKGEGIAPSSIVLEHHSNLTPDEQSWRSKILSENWDAPVIFTTSVQLLEALFSAGTRGARRMHQLARSVIIFDEAQTLPVRCVHMFNNAINFLVEHCGSSVVLCTATQPLLNGVSAEKGAARVSASDEIVPDPSSLFAALKRVTILPRRRAQGWTDAEVAALAGDEIERTGSCLVIVNTRKGAQSLYQTDVVVDGGKKFHLSTAMCPAHRRAIFAEMRDRLVSGKPTLCISTQLIEAGVDIDFGAVVRYVAGLDSIAQGSGRCNRNGLRDSGHVYVINPVEENIESLVDIREGRDVALRILSEYEEAPAAFNNDLLSPAAIERYFEYYFYRRACDMDYPVAADVATRDDTLLRMLADNSLSVEEYKRRNQSSPTVHLRQAFMTAAKAFQAIDAPTRGVLVPYGPEGKSVIANLCGSFKPELQIDMLRTAQQYSVNVFPNVFERLRQSGAVLEIGESTGIFHLHPTYYSEEFGLSELPVNPMETLSA